MHGVSPPTWIIFYLFFETIYAANFCITDVTGDIPWNNFSFFQQKSFQL